MDWQDLLFLHWRVDTAALAPHLPPGLEVDTFDGCAWLGVVPFRMARTRFRWLPPLPTAHRFPELNVRTYVRARGRPGVWFFSLDAASPLAVAGARAGFGLPYFHAHMRCQRDAARVYYESERVDARAPVASFRASWSGGAVPAPALPGTLEHFLVERYCMYAWRRGRLTCGEIAHAAWQLARAEVHLDTCDMMRLLGCELEGPPVSALAAAPVRVAVFWPVAWP
ncbi:MAG TPA: DUF2071 domain-containing protein [Planctomycetota bacterium]|nr:DUF2071 domain-containing protein [Planctomycetota bacterium]